MDAAPTLFALAVLPARGSWGDAGAGWAAASVLTNEAVRLFEFPSPQLAINNALVLALELCACTRKVISLIELGMSRISAQLLGKHIRSRDWTASQIRLWLRSRSGEELKVSSVILGELVRLKLLQPG